MARISHDDGSGRSSGTATLIEHGERESYFLTCAHVFEASGRTTIQSPGGRPLVGRVVAMDRQHDLAIVATRRVSAVAAVFDSSPGGVLTACGYGPSGQRRCVRGPILGYATPQGAVSPSLRMRGAVRPGDSGGPVLNAAGRLVGVVWGARGGETYASFGRPIQRLLGRIRPGGQRQPTSPLRPGGQLRPASDPGRNVGGSAPARSGSGVDVRGGASHAEPGLQERWRATDERVAALEQRVVGGFDRIDARLGELASRDEVQNLGRQAESRLAPLRERLERAVGLAARGGAAAAKPLLGLESIGWVSVLGPSAAGVIVGRYVWRRRRRASVATGGGAAAHATGPVAEGRPIAIDTPPPPQRVERETHYVPYQADDFARAHQWASEQLARKFPGSVEWLASLDSLIKQQLAGRKDG